MKQSNWKAFVKHKGEFWGGECWLSLWMIHIYISQDFMKIFIKFLYFCGYVLPSSVHRYRYIRRIDIDNSEVYVKFCLHLDPYTCIQCNSIFISSAYVKWTTKWSPWL